MPLIHHIDHPFVEGIRVGTSDNDGNWGLTSSCIIYRLGETIIDTGPSTEWQVVKTYLQEKHIQQALITHHHEDHAGNGGRVQHEFDAKIMAHGFGHQWLEKGFSISLPRQAVWGSISTVTPLLFPESLVTDSNIELRPIYMPGHSADMTTILAPEHGWLFSGDLYIASSVKYMSRDEDFYQHIESLQMALTLDFEQLFCAHRGIIDDGKAALAKKLDFLLSLLEQVALLYHKGLSPRAIRLQLLGKEDPVSYSSEFYLSKQNMIDSCYDSVLKLTAES